ncbi:MAG TPA: hypothetical protein PK511_11725 [Chitinophagales bacterium]|nr:hypothetical protein [Cyclobacteriaceae bacterium]HMY34612.1 hypothetical protein [bacterium]HNI55185.1 hypothetical protein [Chitinophagales bacterium]HMY95687.1 hypothetical protein [Cyclobacteriaceae bacterium]HNA14617.1 hypothetical protein [Cyclobacteriaceae bacterium]
MKVSEFIQKLAAKSGINLADEKNKDIATSIASITTELPDESVSKMLGSLMSVDDAKNNSDLKKYFGAQIFDGMDSEFSSIMEEMGFQVSDREAIKATDSAFKKIGAIGRKIKELEEKKSESKGKDKSELQEKINTLTSQLSQLTKDHDNKIKELQSTYEKKLTDSQVRSILKGKKYANDQVPQDVNVELALVLLNKALNENKAVYVNQNGSLVLKQSQDNTLDWMNSSNEKPSFEQYIDGVLAASKLLAVTPTAAAGNSGAGNNGAATIITGGAQNGANASVMNAFDQTIRELESAPLI